MDHVPVAVVPAVVGEAGEVGNKDVGQPKAIAMAFGWLTLPLEIVHAVPCSSKRR